MAYKLLNIEDSRGEGEKDSRNKVMDKYYIFIFLKQDTTLRHRNYFRRAKYHTLAIIYNTYTLQKADLNLPPFFLFLNKQSVLSLTNEKQ